MENLKLNRVISLCKIQVAEFSQAFGKWSFLLPLFILVWPLLTSGGDIGASCTTISRWILMIPIVFIPLINCSSFIFGGNKMMMPASSIEKYTSIWLTSFILIGMTVILCIVVILPLLYVLNIVYFQEDFKEIGLAMIQAISLSRVLSFLAFSTGVVLFVVHQFIPKSKKYTIIIVLVLLFALCLFLVFVLPDSVKDIVISLLSTVISITFIIWGYRSFKQIQLIKKK